MSEPRRTGAHGAVQQPAFLSVARTAQLIGMSVMTLYRAIHNGEFPAVRVRGRLLVPARAIDEMVSAAMASGSVVDAAAWVRPAANTQEPLGSSAPGRSYESYASSSATRASEASTRGR